MPSGVEKSVPRFRCVYPRGRPGDESDAERDKLRASADSDPQATSELASGGQTRSSRWEWRRSPAPALAASSASAETSWLTPQNRRSGDIPREPLASQHPGTIRMAIADRLDARTQRTWPRNRSTSARSKSPAADVFSSGASSTNASPSSSAFKAAASMRSSIRITFDLAPPEALASRSAGDRRDHRADNAQESGEAPARGERPSPSLIGALRLPPLSAALQTRITRDEQRMVMRLDRAERRLSALAQSWACIRARLYLSAR